MSIIGNAPPFEVYYDIWEDNDYGWVMGPKTKDTNLHISYYLDVFEYFRTKEEAEMALMLKNLGVQDE